MYFVSAFLNRNKNTLTYQQIIICATIWLQKNPGGNIQLMHPTSSIGPTDNIIKLHDPAPFNIPHENKQSRDVIEERSFVGEVFVREGSWQQRCTPLDNSKKNSVPNRVSRASHRCTQPPFAEVVFERRRLGYC